MEHLVLPPKKTSGQKSVCKYPTSLGGGSNQRAGDQTEGGRWLRAAALNPPQTLRSKALDHSLQILSTL